MNRVKTIILILSALCSFNGHAQNTDKPSFFPKLFHLNNNVSVGIIGGTMDKFNYGAAGITTSVYGVNVDVMGWPRTNGKIENGYQQDHSQFAAHLGYQIPFHQYQDGCISLLPLLGYVNFTFGATDPQTGTRVSSSGGEFDFGGALVFRNADKHIGSYNFYLAYTRYTAWLGLSVALPLK